jgi:ABC-type Co2+ transport system permease subunit
MHIEPGLVAGAKIVLSFATGAAVLGGAALAALGEIRLRGLPSLAARTGLAAVAAVGFFQALPHPAVGVSEVHLILGSTLFLAFGGGAAALGLAMGLLLQGLLFAPLDLPQYGMNVTTLLAPLLGLHLLARRVIAPSTPYVDLRYGQVLALSAAYQGGIVAWVAFWAFWGQGLGAWPSVATFGAAYMLVVALEPLVDLAVLAGAKAARTLHGSGLVTPRLFAA